MQPGVIILTLTGQTGDLLTLLDLLGKSLFLAKDTDLDLLDDGLVAVGVWLRALRGGDWWLRLGSGMVQGLAGL